MGSACRGSAQDGWHAGRTPAPAPWLWLYGPPGVGKSSIGFEVFSRLVGQGRRVGFIELDQIGMCMPAPTEIRSLAKVDNLVVMLDNFAAAGAEAVIVSGDIAGPAMDDLLHRVSTAPALCRLMADHDVIVERLTTRQSLQYAQGALTYDTDHAVPPGHVSLVTHPRGVAELAAEILDRLGPWPPDGRPPGTAPRAPTLARPPGSAVLISGPRAVGKSAVAWRLHMRSASAGVRSGYLDLEQMSFLQPSAPRESSELTLANVAACWEGFRRRGAERLVLCGLVEGADDLNLYRQLIPSLNVVALTARYDALLERARSRAAHKEIWLPGDDLYGRPDSELRQLARRSAAFVPDGANVVVPTDGLSAADTASRLTYW